MSHIPYGYTIISGRAVIDDTSVEQLQTFFARYLDGQSIDAAGRDIPLGRTCLGNMLKNPVYLGDGYYPQIIDAELFAAVQEERRRRYAARGSPTTAAPINTVPIRTRFHVLEIEESYEDPARQAEYIYGRIKARAKDW